MMMFSEDTANSSSNEVQSSLDCLRSLQDHLEDQAEDSLLAKRALDFFNGDENANPNPQQKPKKSPKPPCPPELPPSFRFLNYAYRQNDYYFSALFETVTGYYICCKIRSSKCTALITWKFHPGSNQIERSVLSGKQFCTVLTQITAGEVILDLAEL